MTVGPLSDQYGRRPIIIVGNCIALLGAIVGASAQHLYVVIIGLIIAGLGSGGQVQAVTILSESVRNQDRGWAQGKSNSVELPSSSFNDKKLTTPIM